MIIKLKTKTKIPKYLPCKITVKLGKQNLLF